MFARVSTFEGPPEGVDPSIQQVRDQVLPAAKQLGGFRGLIAMVDRQTGKAVGVTLWESDEAMRNSEEAANRMRGAGTTAGGARIAAVERFEVALFEVES